MSSSPTPKVTTPTCSSSSPPDRPRSDGYGFDVRSLQELMAARRLTTGDLDTVLGRLRLLAPSPHWRNTWLFAAGRMFSEPQSHQHEKLLEMVETIDDNVVDRFSTIAPVGPYLAWDMLDDGMAAARPRWLRIETDKMQNVIIGVGVIVIVVVLIVLAISSDK